jgi:pectate lyase
MRTVPPRIPPRTLARRTSSMAATTGGGGASPVTVSTLAACRSAVSGTFTSPPYRYTAEPASSVVASVTSGAGAGKL